MENILEEQIERLTPDMRVFLAKRLKEKKFPTHKAMLQRLPRCETENSFPLSFAQERMWFVDQLGGGQAVYNTVSPFRLSGHFNQNVMEKSLNEIIQRHEILRTVFEEVDGSLRQIIRPALNIPLTTIDLCELSETEKGDEIQRLIIADGRQPFDLTHGPLLRTKLLKLDEQEHVFFITIHHIIADGWSYNVLLRELVALYNAFSQDQPSPLLDLPIQYADYAVWQREQLQGNALSEALTYWQQQLAGAPSVLDLPTDQPRQATQSTASAVTKLNLPESLSHKLKVFSQEAGITPFMALLATFQVLIYRYTRQTDIVVGSAIANRTHVETADLLGCFMNPLPLRSDLANNPTFEELLQRVRVTALGAYAHQSLPFEILVKNLHLERSLNHMPVFQTLFILNNMFTPKLELNGLESQSIDVTVRASEYDLSVTIHNIDHEIVGVVEYSTDLFETTTIKRMLGHYETLLTAALDHPTQRIDDLPLITTAERQQLLVDWNRTQYSYPKQSVAQWFEIQAAKNPNQLAVIDERQNLTYDELNQRSNRLAHHLQKLGVGPGTLVAISLERSAEMVVGLLGILKAGGAYVPLDPAYPRQRLAFMLEDTHPLVLLTQAHLLELLPESEAIRVCLDTDQEHIKLESTEDPLHLAGLDDPAYVIYTSGSTGKPKGVQVTHRGLVNFLASMKQKPGLTSDDILLAVTTLSFDIAGLELYLPLVTGAQVVIASREVASDGMQLSKKIVESGATVMQATPATWRMLLAADWEGQSSLKALCGGEALPRDLADSLLERCAEIWNMYGPTETTIWSTTYRVERGGRGNIPIGKPIANTQVYILDARANPQPVGVPGELYIGGAGVAQGYLHRPELTAEKFIPNLFHTDGYSTMYRTGDLARWLPNGNIEYLGRNDHQVKMRGFRIELGEIEAALQECPGIQQSVVTIREDAPGDQRLVAYLLSLQQPLPASGELRSFLKERLPEYMLPSAFIFLERLPLTPAGKVDRKALPAPDRNNLERKATYEAPHTPTEETLAKIWSDVLDVEQIGIHDNFFELGGHSLLTTRVASLIRQVFQLELPLRTLFKAKTLAELAALVDNLQNSEKDKLTPAILPIPRNQPLPLSFSQQWLWFVAQIEPDNPAHNIPAAVRMCGILNQEALVHSLNRIIQRHEILRTTFTLIDNQPLQVIVPQLEIDLQILDLSKLPEAQRDERALAEAHTEANRSFDLACGPLIRTLLLRLAEEEHILLVTMHHIISDGWSFGIFIKELSTFYKAYINKQTPALPEQCPLPPLPIQYADYAAWQRIKHQGHGMERHLAYWKKQLADAPTLTLPTDRPRTAVKTFRGARQALILSTTLTQALKVRSQNEGVTLFMTLLAAFQVMLYRYSGQSDLIVGSPTANRTQAEIEGLIGFFANTLALRTKLSGNPTLRELLARVQETALGAYTHQDIPYEILVENIQQQNGLSYAPLFQVMFILQNANTETLELPDLSLEALDVNRGIARFDLTLSFSENSQQDTEPEKLMGEIEYNTDLFDTTTIEQMTQYYKMILEAMVSHPNQHIDTLPLPSDLEKLQKRPGWDTTEVNGPGIHTNTEYMPPRTPTEKVLAQIWSDVLGIERIGIHDSFFELGGHSLLATQVISRMRQVFKSEMQLLHFFEAPTIAEVAQAIENLGSTEANPQPPTIQRASRERYRIDSLSASNSHSKDSGN